MITVASLVRYPRNAKFEPAMSLWKSASRFLAVLPLLALAGCNMVVMAPSGDIAMQQKDLIIISTDGRKVKMPGLDSEKARKIYAYAQSEEQAWREKNRIRDIEELRAKSGGITLNGSGSPVGAPAAVPASVDDVMKKVKEAKEMLDGGAISDVEFETIKARLLNNM